MIEETGVLDLGEASADTGKAGEPEGADDVRGVMGGEALIQNGTEHRGRAVVQGAGEADRMADVRGDCGGEITRITGGENDEVSPDFLGCEELAEILDRDKVVAEFGRFKDEGTRGIAVAGEVDEARGAIVEIVDELGKGNGGGDAEVVAIAMAGALEGVSNRPQFLVEGEARIRGGSVGSEEPNLHWFGSVGKWPWYEGRLADGKWTEDCGTGEVDLLADRGTLVLNCLSAGRHSGGEIGAGSWGHRPDGTDWSCRSARLAGEAAV